ncbi:AAA family ATPase [Chloroflexota bacterium]
MAIIAISRGTFAGGTKLAELVANKLGYRSMAREVLVDAAKVYGTPQEKLNEALEKSPGILEGLTHERARYLVFIQAALYAEAKGDNIVYHGHAGHILLKDIPNILKIRVIADMEFRLRAVVEQHQTSREEAEKFIKKADERRTRWAKFLYGIDWKDPLLYDMVVNLHHMELDDACEMVCHATTLESYKTTPALSKNISNLALNNHVLAMTAADTSIAYDTLTIESDDGVVNIGGKVRFQEDLKKIENIVRQIPDIKKLNMNVVLWPVPFRSYARLNE